MKGPKVQSRLSNKTFWNDGKLPFCTVQYSSFWSYEALENWTVASMTEEVNFYFSFKWRIWLVTCYWTVHLCRMADADVRRIIGLDVWVEPTWFPPPPIPTPPLPLPWIVMWAGDKQLFALACEGYCLTSWLPWLTRTCVLATTFLKKGQFSLLLIHFRSSRNARGLCWDLVFKALIILFKRWKKWLCGPESEWFHLAPWPYTDLLIC